LSQLEVARFLGMSRPAITLMESGKRSVSTLELTRLAEVYEVSVLRILSDAERASDDDDALATLFRVAPSLQTDAGVRTQLARCLDICGEGTRLGRVLGCPGSLALPEYHLPTPSGAGAAMCQGFSVAAQERRRLDLGSGPIADVAGIVGDQGVWVSGVRLPEDVSGMCLRHASVGVAILVNAAHPHVRSRLSYAHEFGHALMDRRDAVMVTGATNSSALSEKRANAFAAAFLTPEEAVRATLRSMGKGQPSRHGIVALDVATGGESSGHSRPEAGSQRLVYQDVARIAHRFGVSYETAAYRLRSLRMVAVEECRDLLARASSGQEYLRVLGLSGNHDRPKDECGPARHLECQVAHLALEAYRRERISRRCLRDLTKTLDLPWYQLSKLAEAATNAHHGVLPR
jgi:Zn-dependent peptidase ImmA (M78 family)